MDAERRRESLTYTARVIRDAFLISVNPDARSSDNKVQSFVVDTGEKLKILGIDQDMLAISLFEISKTGNSAAHTMSAAIVEKDINFNFKETDIDCPFSDDTVKFLQLLYADIKEGGKVKEGKLDTTFKDWEEHVMS